MCIRDSLKNLILNNNKIEFNVSDEFKEKINDALDNDESKINPYYPEFKTHQLLININNDKFILELSDYGLVLIKNSSLEQAIEIVRRRVDELGTNEPTIVKRGNDRVLVELPGLDDPSRIKKLLGKTANLSFQFVSNKAEGSFGIEKLKYDGEDNEEFVSRRIIISGENLIDASPSMNSQTNETVVTFNLDLSLIHI